MSTEPSAAAVRTTCPYCGVGCGVLARPDGIVVGDPDHPANAGRLCSKGAALGETLGLDGRLLHPEINGQRARWDMALDLIAERFAATIAAHGPDSVALYVSGQLLTEDYYAANKLAKAVFGTANIDSNSRLCMASSVAGHRRAFGEDIVPGIYEDLELADLLVLVGSNTAWCHPVLFQRIQAARARRPDMRVVVVDPRRTATCEGADLHLALRPGSDVALFTGLLADLWSHGARADAAGMDDAVAVARRQTPDAKTTALICGLAETDVARFFAMVRATPRVVTLFSQGVNQSSAGTDKVNAIINTHLLTGGIGVPGAGPFSITGQPNAMGGREVGALANMLAAHLEWDRPGDLDLLRRFWGVDAVAESPGLKAIDLFRAIGDGRVRAVWIMGTNPAVSLPRTDMVRAALTKCPFVVVSECAAGTDTARLAHVRLPALGWGEKDGTVTNSERVISRQRAFLPAPGEARADWRAIAGVAARMGHGARFSWIGPAAIFREHAALSGFGNDGARMFDISAFAAINDHGYDALAPTRWPCPAGWTASVRLLGAGRFPTPDGRPRAVTTPFRGPTAGTSATFPLALLTGRLRDQWHTMTRTGSVSRLMAHAPEPEISVHPADTALPQGSLVRIASADGSAVLRLRHDQGLARGTAFAPMHWTAAFCPSARVNAVIGDATDPISGQPELKATPISIALAQFAWHGFALLRGRLPMEVAAWCAAVPEPGGLWRHVLAGYGNPAAALAILVAATRLDGAWSRMDDAAAGTHRAVRVLDGRIAACVFICASDDILPPLAWLMAAFSQPAPPALALLAGGPPGGRPTFPTICICHGIDAGMITRAISAGCTSVTAIGETTGAGTGCGSCRPEIGALVSSSVAIGDTAL
ncbi:MAG: molybdopterin-dependent oxidoreductase [Rubritepida sp.]|nr:molybdopterin-dependent oxidoreductase [Rubritepida sp.]